MCISYFKRKIAALFIYVNVVNTFLRDIVCKISALGLYVLSLFIRVSVETVTILSSCFSCVLCKKKKKKL